MNIASGIKDELFYNIKYATQRKNAKVCASLFRYECENVHIFISIMLN